MICQTLIPARRRKTASKPRITFQTLLVVGFIEKALIAEVTPENRPHHVRIALSSNRSDKTPYIAAVPLTKLMVDRMPVLLEPKNAQGPVMLEMDLQGTANRKSVPGLQ